MEGLTDAARWEAELRNAAYMVRMYCRPGQGALRAQAIQRMGLTAREAFNRSDDFERLLVAVVEGLKPEQYKKPF